MVDWDAGNVGLWMLKRVPKQSIAPELLDGAIDDHQLLRANLREMARANRWLGGNRAVLRRVVGWLAARPREQTVTILDVATGSGDLPVTIHEWGLRQNRSVALLASDLSREVLAVAQQELQGRPVRLLRHDALRMPFRDRSVDIVTCSQALHHFAYDEALRLLHELARVARIGVIVNDLRRSYPAYWGARLLAAGPVSALSRHDGPLSVLRAYTAEEVTDLVKWAGLPAQVRRARGFRVEIELTKG